MINLLSSPARAGYPVSGMPSEALSDKDQAMPPDMFAGLMKKLQILRSYMKEIDQGKKDKRSR